LVQIADDLADVVRFTGSALAGLLENPEISSAHGALNGDANDASSKAPGRARGESYGSSGHAGRIRSGFVRDDLQKRHWCCAARKSTHPYSEERDRFVFSPTACKRLAKALFAVSKKEAAEKVAERERKREKRRPRYFVFHLSAILV
jgi:hypothetical protein